MENTNIVTTEQQAPNTISASNAFFNVQALGQLTAFANLMADSQVTVPAHLAGKPADCMAIVMQAMQWGMNPYACWSLSAGANPNFIATQMGHTDAQMVYKVYGKWMSEKSAEQVSLLNQALSRYAPSLPQSMVAAQ